MFEQMFQGIDEMIAEQLDVDVDVYIDVIESLSIPDAEAIITPLMTDSTEEEQEEAIRLFKEFQEKT